MSDRNPLTWNKVGDAKVLDVTPKTESGLWADLQREADKPGPTMTITKAQYAALLDAARAAAPAGEPPKPVGPTCVLCPWSQDIGHAEHARFIHPDADLIVIEQMGQKFIVRRPAPDRGVGLRRSVSKEPPMMSEPQTESGRALYREVRSVEWGDEMRRGILAIEQEAASKAVVEVLDRLEERVAIMKACAPDGDYIRWDVQHADVDLHYVNRSGVRALIASERKP